MNQLVGTQVRTLASLDDSQQTTLVNISDNEVALSPLRGALAQAQTNQNAVTGAYAAERQSTQDAFDAAVGALNVKYSSALIQAAQEVSDAQTALDQQIAVQTAVDIQAASDAGTLPPDIPLPSDNTAGASPPQKVG
jgi:hypothetical protein